jgi:hypothetical protein
MNSTAINTLERLDALLGGRRRYCVCRATSLLVLGLLVVVASVATMTATLRHSQERVLELSTKVLDAGDPPRPPGSESLRAFILIPIGSEARLHLTGLADGVDFDIDADHRRERVAWTRAGAEIAFLFLDLNHDGRVTSGRELIGGGTTHEAWNGFMALRVLEPTARGAIAAGHPLYSRLRLWVDRNHDGRSEDPELRPVGEVFQQIGLGYFVPRDHDGLDAHGNVVRYQGWLQKTGPSTESESPRYHPAYEVVLRVSAELSQPARRD